MDIEHIDHIVDMRRYQVLMESEFPSELGVLFKNLENKGNPWGQNSKDRLNWINEVEFDVPVYGKDVDTIPRASSTCSGSAAPAPMNYGDFARYGKDFKSIKKGNFLGLPVNFLVFSLLVVVTAAATRPVFGELIIDPVHTVAKLDNVYAVILGALTFMIATVGINIVANFVSPAFDFSNVNPQKISWRMGGMIAAVGSVLITPWNLYNSPETIHYTLDTLGAFIGPLYGVLIADYYLIKKRRVNIDALYTLDAGGKYHYKGGYNPVAIVATAISACAGMIVVFWGSSEAATYTWFIGAGLRLRPVHDRQPDVRPEGQLPDPGRLHGRRGLTRR